MFIIDSYSETNYDASIVLANGYQLSVGQSITNISKCVLDSSKFYLYKSGSPTGDITSSIYNYTGTPGTDAVPSGSALATSDAVDVSSLPTPYTSIALVTFTFSGINRITLSAGTNYIITVNYSGGDITNCAAVGDDTHSPTHSGNWCQYTVASGWIGANVFATVFYAYGLKSGPFPTFFRT